MVLLRVALFILALLGLPDWYLYSAFVKGRGLSRRRKCLLWLPSVLLLLALGVFIVMGRTYHEAFGIYLIIAFAVCIPKAIFVVLHLLLRGIGLVGIRNRLHRAVYNKVSTAVCSLIAVAALASIVFGATVGKHLFRVREVTYTSDELPSAFDEYRIVQISDIHTGSWNNDTTAMRRAVELCNDLQADAVAFTGDLVNSESSELKPYMRILSQLTAKDGVFSILGNHDYAMYSDWNSEAERMADVDSLIAHEGAMGWQMLINDHRIIRRGNDSIAIVGVENSGRPPFPDRADLPKALQGTDGMFKVLLSHDPTHWRRSVLPNTDIDLTLSGHTHDMQIKVFGFSPSVFVYPEYDGMYTEGKRALFVNIGLGYVLFPMRIGAWPEITVITLKKQ